MVIRTFAIIWFIHFSSLLYSQSNVGVSINFTPSYSGLTGSGRYNAVNELFIKKSNAVFTIQYGLSLDLLLFKRFELEMGLSSLSINQNYIYQYSKSQINIEDRVRTVELQYIGLPLLLKYRLYNQKLIISPFAGLCFDHKLSQSDNYDVVSLTKIGYIEDKIYSNSFFSFSVGVESKYIISEHFFTKFAFFLTRGITDILSTNDNNYFGYTGNEKIYFYGLNIGVGYMFNNKSK